MPVRLCGTIFHIQQRKKAPASCVLCGSESFSLTWYVSVGEVERKFINIHFGEKSQKILPCVKNT